jgi:hypothetical protein
MGVVAPERRRTRPESVPPPEPPRRRQVPWGLIAVAAVVLGIWAAPGFIRDLLPGFPNPFASETIDRSRPALLRSIRDLQEFHGATGHFEVIVDLEQDTRLPSEILGERTLFVAVGDVDAVVDLGAVEERDVTVSDDRREATLVLPSPRLKEAELDIDKSYVYSRERGVLNRVGGLFGDEKNAEREVFLIARRRIAEAAGAGSGLIPRAERNTSDVLEGLLQSLGFTRTDIRFEPAE